MTRSIEPYSSNCELSCGELSCRRRRSRVRQMRLDLFHDRIKSGRVGDGQVAEHLAVQLNAGFGQSWNEAIIVNPALLEGGVEARDPQGAEVALFLAAVAIGINAGLAGEFQ